MSSFYSADCKRRSREFQDSGFLTFELSDCVTCESTVPIQTELNIWGIAIEHGSQACEPQAVYLDESVIFDVSHFSEAVPEATPDGFYGH